MGRANLLLAPLRGLLLRCPVCGKGRIGKGRWGLRASCPACGHRVEGGYGEFTGAMMLAQFGWTLLGLYGWFVFVPQDAPLSWLVAWIVLFGAAIPLLTYRNVKGLWVGILAAGRDLFERDAG